VLLAALAQALAPWTGSPVLLLDQESQGREAPFDGADLSRTVGWFRTIAPLLLDLRDTHGPEATLKAVKEHLRRVPQHGIGYGLLRYLRDDAALRAQPQAELLFSYQGQLDQPSGSMSLARHTGLSHPRGSSRYLLEVSGYILDGQLQLDWTYSTQRHQQVTIARLADACLEALRTLITRCTAAEAPSYTPSDFPQAELKQEVLDKFIARISKREVMQ
jgi:non-ribosomal peptide synthase protein (TIGR01720 family)